jgi:hypothetical protein
MPSRNETIARSLNTFELEGLKVKAGRYHMLPLQPSLGETYGKMYRKTTLASAIMHKALSQLAALR